MNETSTPLHESCVADAHAPTFEAEWQRRAFGVAVALAEFGHYPWSSFQRQLIAAIGDWEGTAEPERGGWEYYEHWLAALEKILVEHSLLSMDELPR